MEPIINAKMATQITLANSDMYKQMQQINEQIRGACFKGLFGVTVPIELNNRQSLVIAEEIVNSLIGLGYSVAKVNPCDAFSTTIKLNISWGVSNEKGGD